MRVVDYIAQRLRFLGVTQAYMVTGGAAMHLNDAISREFGDNLHFLHHEQSCAIAAESFARVTNTPCLVNVTAGPGGINAINGVFGAFVDSIPMIVLSGQSKRETLVVNSGIDGLRQLGDQEVDIVHMVSKISKISYLLQDPFETSSVIDRLFKSSVTGRPGPVWLDIPIDVQSFVLPNYFQELVSKPLAKADSTLQPSDKDLDIIASHLLSDNRPVLYVGSGIRSSNAYQEFLDFLEQWPIPCVTGWNSNDLLWDQHECYSGRPGTIGNRTGNFAVQFSGCVVVVGCRLNIRQISYNWQCFARNAWTCQVDIDVAELNKPTLKTDLKVHADAKGFFPLLSKALQRKGLEKEFEFKNVLDHWGIWRKWLKDSLLEYPVTRDSLPSEPGVVNPYKLVQELSYLLPEKSVTVCSDGTACVVGFQSSIFKKNQRMFHNSGCASMGYELPAAIGAYHATEKVITCLAGDGSIMMNLQELSIIGGKQYPIKIILLNNSGYHSIRQTQHNYFPDNLVGCGADSGLVFPLFSNLAKALNIRYSSITDDDSIAESLSHAYIDLYPHIVEVFVNKAQQFSPKLTSSKLDSGEMVSSNLEDMSPHLTSDEMSSIQKSAFLIKL